MPTFDTFWSNHPTIKGDAPLLDNKAYENQCAIGVSAALIRSGVDMKSYTGVWSWEKDKPKYAIRAHELAVWLSRQNPNLPTKVEKFSGKVVFDKIKGRRGIIYFRHYWGPGNQGDHIDFWNGNRLTDWTSWIRIQGGIVIPGVWSDFEKSESVWFWPLP
jgi:hypothetical protein